MQRGLPPIHLLVTFEAVARRGSVRLAAAEAFVTPSAISQQVKQLEEHLELSLVQREGRGLALTQEGRAIATWAAAVVATYREGYARTMAELGAPIVRLSATDYIAHELLIPGLPRFHALHPDVDLRLETSMAIVDLHREPVDAAVRLGNAPFEGLAALPLGECQGVIVGSAELAARKPVREARHLNEHVLIRARGDRDDWREVAALGGLPALRPKKMVVVDGYLASLRAAERGVGLAIALLPSIQPWLDQGRLVALTPPVPAGAGMHFVFREDNPRAELLRSVYAWAKGELDRAGGPSAVTGRAARAAKRTSSARTRATRRRTR